jgi:hypothetical protein
MIRQRQEMSSDSSNSSTTSTSTTTTVNVDNFTWVDKSGRAGLYSGTFNTLHSVPDGTGEMNYAIEGLPMHETQNSNNDRNSQDRTRNSTVLSYRGQWVDGDKSGYGVMTFTSGEVYEGGFFDNHRHGLGIIKYANGSVFDGIFRLGRIHGKGRMLYDDGSVYWGHFIHTSSTTTNYNSQYHGEGTDTVTCLRIVPHGRGKLTFADGATVYDGEFCNGQFDGHGKLTHNDGSWYLGEFVDGKKNGIGLEVRADGTISHEGVFYNGQKLESSSVKRPKRSLGQLILYQSSYSMGARSAMLVGPMPCRLSPSHCKRRPM